MVTGSVGAQTMNSSQILHELNKLKFNGTVLYIAAHPDDEVLGMGGTIRKLTNEKNTVHLCVITEGASAQYSDQKMIKIRKESCKKSSKIFGCARKEYLDGSSDGKNNFLSLNSTNVFFKFFSA